LVLPSAIPVIIIRPSIVGSHTRMEEGNKNHRPVASDKRIN
jgi:hypothetical protein